MIRVGDVRRANAALAVQTSDVSMEAQFPIYQWTAVLGHTRSPSNIQPSIFSRPCSLGSRSRILTPPNFGDRAVNVADLHVDKGSPGAVTSCTTSTNKGTGYAYPQGGWVADSSSEPDSTQTSSETSGETLRM